MRRMRKLGISLALAALVGTGLLVSPATASTTDGTWTLYPEQTAHTTSVVTNGFAYKSAVRAPINADGTSNWPAKRGVIPVQFDLLAAPSTTTTTTTTYDPPVFESDLSNTDTDDDFSFLSFVPAAPGLTFDQLTVLKATYHHLDGNCGGGALRWQVRIDENDNGVRDAYVDPSTGDGALYIYYGEYPNFTDCETVNQSGLNLLSFNDLRFDTSQLGGTFYDTKAGASALVGDNLALNASLIMDAGWFPTNATGADRLDVLANVTVNDNTFVPKTAETTTSTVTGAFAKTCDLPAAELSWKKNDATPSGAINEAESIQPKDTGQFYRNVDCKYIYNLDVRSLTGDGTYTVWVRIGGVNIQVPATFDLR
jgi:hypothetical protein